MELSRHAIPLRHEHGASDALDGQAIPHLLRSGLRGTPCSVFGPDLGIQAGTAIRYPDALITYAKLAGTDRIATDVRTVFEVLSPSSAHTDRIIKVREYALVPSLRRYVLVETRFPGLTVLHRASDGAAWTVLALTVADRLSLLEMTADLPVALLYEDVDFPPDAAE